MIETKSRLHLAKHVLYRLCFNWFVCAMAMAVAVAVGRGTERSRVRPLSSIKGLARGRRADYIPEMQRQTSVLITP